VIAKERKHALSLDEVDGEKDFAAFLTFDRVYLSDRDVRMLLKESLEILISAADAASLVHLDSTLFLPRSEPDLARQIDVLGGDGTIIDEAIDRSLAGHDQVLVIDIDMVRRMVFLNQRRDDGIKFGELFFRERDPGSGLREELPVVILSILCFVKHFLKVAGSAFATAIADKGSFLQSYA
jgi:hypothetical protein